MHIEAEKISSTPALVMRVFEIESRVIEVWESTNDCQVTRTRGSLMRGYMRNNYPYRLAKFVLTTMVCKNISYRGF